MELITCTAIIVFTLLIIMEYTKKPLDTPDPLSAREFVYSKLAFIGVVVVLLFVACFREGFVDTHIYKGIYRNLGTDYSKVDSLEKMEEGFVGFMIFLNHISPDPQLMIIITSLVTVGVHFYIIRKYACDLPFTLFLFFTVIFMGLLNGIRQVLAGAVMQLAFVWLLEKKPIRFMLLALLMTNIHTSVAIMMPLYFVISGKRTNMGIWLFLVAVGLCFVAPGVANQAMGKLLEDSVYKEYLENETRMGGMRLLVASCALFMTLLMRFLTPRTEDQHGRVLDVMINLHIVNVGFTALGLRMVHFARIAMYVSYAMPILLPYCIRECFEPRSARFLKYTTIFLYLLYFTYQINTFKNQGYLIDFKLCF